MPSHFEIERVTKLARDMTFHTNGEARCVYHDAHVIKCFVRDKPGAFFYVDDRTPGRMLDKVRDGLCKAFSGYGKAVQV